ncbi:MAG: hypothetical protein K0R57_1334 [Paenibacillaceae bacterium]|jgi:hypothetical protein|nr:hypothetical protein [Paenibacillaceae bacterium]
MEKAVDWISYGDIRMKWYGLAPQEEAAVLCRMPQKVLPVMSDTVSRLAYCTSGARVRFRTNSAFLKLEAEMREGECLADRGGISGFDLYHDASGQMRFSHLFLPDPATGMIRGEYEFQQEGMKEVLIHFPLMTGIRQLRIGVEPGADLLQPQPYCGEAPIVFYGSSITQGAHASRPGNSYPLILSRWLNTDIHNLGFGGGARGERQMADYIAGLKMCCFVLDYDHNAPSPAYLEDTHYSFYHTVRQAQPTLPIILVSRPDFDLQVEDSVARRQVIRATYDRGRKNGDNHLWLADGELLFGERERDACTVDTCHPNDLGFMRMAEALYPLFKQALA